MRHCAAADDHGAHHKALQAAGRARDARPAAYGAAGYTAGMPTSRMVLDMTRNRQDFNVCLLHDVCLCKRLMQVMAHEQAARSCHCLLLHCLLQAYWPVPWVYFT